MLRVTIFNENLHEREIPAIREVYPMGIHGCLASLFENDPDIQVKTATFEMPEHGLTEEVLENTDVLIYWSHALQDQFSDVVTARIRDHVHRGMGLVALHSAHYSKIMRTLLGTPMTLQWRDDDHEKLWCVTPGHPIAAGVSPMIELEMEEMYGEPFGIPDPDELIFIGSFSRGEVFRSGCVFNRGRGKIFYFQPGHEAYPNYMNPEIRKIIYNGTRYVAPVCKVAALPENIHAI